MWGASCSARSWRTSASQGSAATRAVTAQVNNPHRHPSPPAKWWAMGTVNTEAAVRPTAIAVV